MPVDLAPTQAVADAAARGLRLYEDGKAGSGLRPETVADARLMASRSDLSERKVRRMPAWFARHESDRRPGWDKAGEETPGFVAWLLWGGDPGRDWATRKVAEMDRINGQEGNRMRILTETDLRDRDLLAELRERPSDFIERRYVNLEQVETRATADGGFTVRGLAAVFGQESNNLGGFTEQLSRGAFRKVLRSNPDCRLLFNHDPNFPLARTASGTLTLAETPSGLLYEASVAPTTAGKDLRILLDRGDVSQSSFAFTVAPGGDSWTQRDDGTLLRTITDLSGLYDCSIVTYPAYEQTSAQARSSFEDMIEAADESSLAALAESVHSSEITVSDAERELLEARLGRSVEQFVEEREGQDPAAVAASVPAASANDSASSTGSATQDSTGDPDRVARERRLSFRERDLADYSIREGVSD